MSSSSRVFKCKNSPDLFCYICGKYTLTKQALNLNQTICDLFHEYFGFKVADQNKAWAPHKVCSTCVRQLKGWKNSNGQIQMRCPTPVYWTQVTNHQSDCYFCQINVIGVNMKSKQRIVYPNVKSAVLPSEWKDGEIRPLPSPPAAAAKACDQESAGGFCQKKKRKSDLMDNHNDGGGSGGGGGGGGVDDGRPKLLSQIAFNELVNTLDLSATQTQILGSSLNDRKLLTPDCVFTYYRGRQTGSYAEFFEEEEED